MTDDYPKQYAKAVDDSGLSDRQAFLMALHRSIPATSARFPHYGKAADTLAASIYADWLDDHGENVPASIIRQHVASTGNGGVFSIARMLYEKDNSEPYLTVEGVASDGSGGPYGPQGKYFVSLIHKLPFRDHWHFTHVSHTAYMPAEQVHEIAKEHPELTNGRQYVKSLEKLHPHFKEQQS